MIAFAMHLLEQGALSVEIHPDGEHGKRHDVKASLAAHGFKHTSGHGTTKYAGIYSRGEQRVLVTIKPGVGDVVARVGEQKIVAECKGRGHKQPSCGTAIEVATRFVRSCWSVNGSTT